MSRFEIMRENKAQYEVYSKKIAEMTGLTKLVAENLVLVWIKGNNWMGGISDSRYESIYERKLKRFGYTYEQVHEEFENQIMRLCNI